jgi:hypothetical protein
MAIPASAPAVPTLLPSALGHVARGSAVPRVEADAIEAFAPRVLDAHRRTVETGREHGFLAYFPAGPGLALQAEDEAVGTRHDIRWHWRERDATVAFSFHTHPGKRAACAPSGMDLVGALVRGDHLLYILTDDGKLAGWRFRDPAGHPKTVEGLMRAMETQGRFDRAFVRFLYDATEAMRDALVEVAYEARVAKGRIVRAQMV